MKKTDTATKWLEINPMCGPDIPAAPGVYVIYLGRELVYVGQSNNLRARLARHNFRFGYGRTGPLGENLKTPWGNFPDTTDLTMKIKLSQRLGDWAMLEIRLIHRLRPRFNFTHASRRAMALT